MWHQGVHSSAYSSTGSQTKHEHRPLASPARTVRLSQLSILHCQRTSLRTRMQHSFSVALWVLEYNLSGRGIRLLHSSLLYAYGLKRWLSGMLKLRLFLAVNSSKQLQSFLCEIGAHANGTRYRSRRDPDLLISSWLRPWVFSLAQLLLWLPRLLLSPSRRAGVAATEPKPFDEGDDELLRVSSEIGEPGIPVSGQESDELSSQPPPSTCSHCRTIQQHSWSGLSIFPRAFHEECDRFPSPRTTMASFCPFWQHLRLEHVYKCCLFSGLRSDQVHFHDFQPCRQCPGCRIIRKGIASSRIDRLPQPSISLQFDFYYGHLDGDSNPKRWVGCSIEEDHRTGVPRQFASIDVYGDYHGSSVSDDVVVKETRLDDSDWISLREQLEDTSHVNAHG